MRPSPAFGKTKVKHYEAVSSNAPLVQTVQFQIGYPRGAVDGGAIDLKKEIRRLRFNLNGDIVAGVGCSPLGGFRQDG